ncbi:serendipity locus protein alpha-like [Asbolus verrucosus]|uniref:Serendipity locus protein alpha-like n=1 Tax=Asbolus verrucosus TaxID=1661398 RepID=A0A482VR78_ASBVE|nr:serendipity locus protein alpha-like [Asbolus verrucosus]
MKEVRKCIIKQIICCLESIDVTVNSGKVINDPSGNFVKWMDASLDKISEIKTQQNKAEIYNETRELFEEVLSHAMSIAQVSLDEDSKIIRGSCQSVLHALNSLDKEENLNMINLFVDACSDKLCILERKVNTAVLKLCLETFSQYTQPLEKIHSFCFRASNRSRIEELDGLVADFDLHVDRIMQIGLFAVSCSSNSARGIKIRSCLASLEALESELVPALTSVLLDSSAHNTNCAALLTQHWISQAVTLQELIFLIIDPLAFCQVVYEAAAEFVDGLSSNLKMKKSLKLKEISQFLQIVKVLENFFDKAQSEFGENEGNRVKTKLKDFNDVVEEVESASNRLLNETNSNVENSTRVLKRCKILLTVLKRLWYCFVDDPSLNPKPSPKLEPIEPTGNAFLDHIINRGKQILQDRSVLYRTPIKNAKLADQKIPLSKLVHLRKLSFINVKNETSLDLQITDILGEMTNISTYKLYDSKV